MVSFSALLVVVLLAYQPSFAQAPATNTELISWQDVYVFSQPVLTYVSEPTLHLYTGTSKCSCVEYAKAVLGKQDEVWGNAGRIKPNSNQPSVGVLVLLNEGKSGHAGVVISYTEETITITESNYKPCAITERTLSRNYVRIRGYKVVNR